MVDRRTVVVLGSLLVAMTLTGSLLLMLEPQQASITSAPALQALEANLEPEKLLFQTDRQADPDQWQAIVVRFSGHGNDSVESLDLKHKQLGLGGLGYHFVINNGQSQPDGLIEVGYRWNEQLSGAHSFGEHAYWLNSRAIGVCLVGNGREQPPTDTQLQQLVWLVHQLQLRFNIPADRVMVETGGPDQQAPLFPAGSFRQQLLIPAGP